VRKRTGWNGIRAVNKDETLLDNPGQLDSAGLVRARLVEIA
jgi:hypothetical protein